VLRPRLALVVLCALAAWCAAQAPALLAAGATPAEVALAEKYAPVMRLAADDDRCKNGAPYRPLDVNVLFGNDEVVLRGPWDDVNVVAIAPVATDLTASRVDYHLDFPGNALDPDCRYEELQQRLEGKAPPTIYARAVTEPGYPGKLALQYWFFYLFNDFNNTHEGDWEMIQLVFDADTAEQALTRPPVEVGYSAHEGAERARWGEDSKLEIVDGTHPVVYPGAGSQANKFRSALYLGRSASEGVGCDDTRGPWEEIRPRVVTVPENRAAYLAEFPWLAFGGRWGERQPAFFNGPTGMNLKTQWTKPITWMETWRDESFTIPASGVFGPEATDFFCAAVARGSAVLTKALRNWVPVVLVLVGLVALAAFAISRTTWRDAATLHLTRRRTWGHVVACGWRLYREHLGLFVRIGLVFVPVALSVALAQWLVFELGLKNLLAVTGRRDGFAVGLALEIGLAFTIFGLTVVQAAVARAMADIDAGRHATALGSYRQLRGKVKSLLAAALIAVVIAEVLQLTLVGIPIVVWLVGCWALMAQVIALEDRPAVQALVRSFRLVRGHWFRVASLILVTAGFVLVVGPLIGVLLLFASSASFNVINIVSGLVYAVAMPFVAITTTYLYHDLRVREQLEPRSRDRTDTLPAEIQT